MLPTYDTDLLTPELAAAVRAAVERHRAELLAEGAASVFTKAWDKDSHPRDDHGRFVEKHAIEAAKGDHKKAAELRAKVTDPAERKKLDKALAEEPDDKGKNPAAKPPTGTLGTGDRVNFIPHHTDGYGGRATVLVDPHKLNAAWSKDANFHIPEGGGGAEIAGRRDGFKTFLETGQPVEQPAVMLVGDRVVFGDGRHRFSVLRDAGIDRIPVTVPADQANDFLEQFGASTSESADATAKPTRATAGTVDLDATHKLAASLSGLTGERKKAALLKLADRLQGHTAAELKQLKERLGIRASGPKAELARKLAERAANPDKSSLRHYTPAEGRLSVDDAHALIGGHLEAGRMGDPKVRKEVADAIERRMSVKDIRELKQRLGIAASGEKYELARKIAERAKAKQVASEPEASSAGATNLPPEATNGKPPHELTREEHARRWHALDQTAAHEPGGKVRTWDDEINQAVANGDTAENAREWLTDLKSGGHRSDVQAALAAGKPVPAHVLAEYPDLAPKVEPPPAAPPGSMARLRARWMQGGAADANPIAAVNSAASRPADPYAAHVANRLAQSDTPPERRAALASEWAYHAKRNNTAQLAHLRERFAAEGLVPLHADGAVVPFDGRLHESASAVSDGQPVRVTGHGWRHPDEQGLPTQRATVEPADVAKVPRADGSAPQTPGIQPPAQQEPASAPTSHATPREAATAATTAAKDDYAFARQSGVANAGEDLKGSARHKRNEWRGLAEAEANGTAGELVRREHLLKNEPHALTATIEPHTALQHLAAHLALNAFPSEPGGYPPGYDKYKSRDGGPLSRTSPEELRKQYHEAYRAIKAAAETAATTEADPRAVLKAIAAETKKHIAKARGVPEGATGYEAASGYSAKDPYNPVGNALIDLHNRAVGSGAKATHVMARVHDFAKRVKEKYGDAVTPETLAKAHEHALDIIEGESANKTFGTTKEGGAGHFSPADAYVNHVTRKGGRVIDTSTIKAGTDFVTKAAGMRGLQWGNSVSDDERQHHLTKTSEALADLADVTGLPDSALSLNGTLGLAIGARGKGKAMAHYEPGTKVINLTRKKGAGTIAHEWGHALDHFVAGGGLRTEGNKTTGEFLSNGHARGEPGPEIGAAMTAVKKAFDTSGFEDRARGVFYDLKRQGRIPKTQSWQDYWGAHHEKFARAFEKHVAHKLKSDGRANTYLSGISDHGLWPTDAEAAHMAPHFEKLLAAIKGKHFATG